MTRLLLATMLVALLWASPATAAPALTLTTHARAYRQGEAVLVTVTAPDAATDVVVRAFGTAWPTVRAGTTWSALVGIDLDTRPGSYPVDASATLDGDTASARRTVTVTKTRFRVRRLSVAPAFINPTLGQQAQIDSDAAFMRTVYASRRDDAGWALGFVRPVPQVANSAFGSRSVFNGEARAPHAGTDFLSPAGTPVVAPGSGAVVAARPLFFTGNTVVIDHGSGVFSVLAHLSQIAVSEGDLVAAGDAVGLVGATGRVTGPHLHWAVRIGAARVDALSMLAVAGSGR